MWELMVALLVTFTQEITNPELSFLCWIGVDWSIRDPGPEEPKDEVSLVEVAFSFFDLVLTGDVTISS